MSFFDEETDDLLDSKIFTFTGNTPNQESSGGKLQITGREQTKLIAGFVALPGATGGVAKAAQEALDPNISKDPYHALATVPAYAFLGAISAILAVAFISDSIKKTHLKLIAISLACGLVFPSVLSSSTSIIQLQTEIQSLQQEKSEKTTLAIDSLSDATAKATDIDLQLEFIDELIYLAETSEDLEVRQSVLNSLQQIANKVNPRAKAKIDGAVERLKLPKIDPATM